MSESYAVRSFLRRLRFPGCDGQVAHLPALRYAGEGRKEFEVKRSKVEPERLISSLQDLE
jgi:hypothetical protein